MNKSIRLRCFAAAFALLFTGVSAFALSSVQILPRNAVWAYSDTGADLGAAWTAPSFDDKAWKTGKAPLGFGDDFSETDPKLPIGTVIDFGKADSKWMCTYFRATVDVSADALKAPELEIYIHVDDGAVVYVNGKEAFRRGIKDGEAVAFGTSAKFKPKEETFRVPSTLLKAGKNVIAAEVHQDSGDSSDLWFELGIATVAAQDAAVAPAAAAAAALTPAAPRGAVTKVVATFSSDAITTRAFAWYTTQASVGTDLEIVAKSGKAPADFAKALKFKGSYGISTNSPSEVWHKAIATGLAASTGYWYRVGDSALNLWSETGSFTTAKASGAFTFIDLADTQAKSEDEAVLSASTLAKASAAAPDSSFMILNGDIVDTGSNETQWNWMLGHSSATLLNTTFVPVAGNHDEDPQAFIEHFSLPVPAGSDTKTGAYYSFDFQGSHFIVLNNNEDSPEWADFTPAQIAWLKDDVARARKAGALWTIVAMHKGPYSTSNHATDVDMTDPANGVRTKFAPLAESLGIDLVLQGHDHIYARTKPLSGGVAAKKGTVYVIPATAGPKVYYRNKKIDPSYFNLFAVADENHAAAYGADPADASRPLRAQIQNYTVYSVSDKQLVGTSWEIDQAKNGGVPYVIDTFTIAK